MRTIRPSSVGLRGLAVASCLALLVAACGDDDADTATSETTSTTAGTTTTSTDAELATYCELMDAMNNQDGPPTEAQLTDVKDVVPEDIADDVNQVADAFLAADGDFGKVFGDPAIEEAFGRIDAYNADACGFEPSDDEGPPQGDTAAADGATVIPVTAVDFEFQGVPAEVPAGKVAFQFTNGGDSSHEMVIVELGDGVDLDELLAADTEPSEDQAKDIGGTYAPAGEDGGYVNADLEPGTYAVLCFIPGPGGKPHYELGMKTTFTVS